MKIYKKNAQNWRNIGLGVFNYAHMLMALGLTYGSQEALEFTNELFDIMAISAFDSNIKRGLEKGCFPNFIPDIVRNSSMFRFLFDESKTLPAMRNCTLLSIAPTGSIATMLGGSGGVEPEFALSYTRRTDNLNDKYTIDSKIVRDYKQITGNNEIPSYFVTSKDIKWQDRIKTQGIIQQYIDTAISSTVNLPKEITVEEIEQLYLFAWKKGLKGVTIFRDGCKRSGILTTESSDKNVPEPPSSNLYRGEVIPVNDTDAIGFKRSIMSGCGRIHCTAFFDVNSGDLVETYFSKGSTGGCNNYMIGLSRMISLAARGGISIEDIVDQLMSTGSCPSYAARSATKHDTSKGSCCPMAIGYALKEMWEEFQGKEMKPKTIAAPYKEKQLTSPKCPECGGELHFEGGCNICRECGYTKCD